MKKIITLVSIICLVYSCKKEAITPGNYKVVPTQQDTSHWQSQYSSGGVLPNWGGGSNVNNEVYGTKWVLTYLQVGFSSPPLPIDTILFVNNTHYTINSGAVKPYTLTSGVGVSSKSLTLYYHYPFGSGHYSGQVSSSFVSDGVILNCEFVNINTSTTKVRASFNKIL